MINYNNDNDCDSELSSIFGLYKNDKSPLQNNNTFMNAFSTNFSQNESNYDSDSYKEENKE